MLHRSAPGPVVLARVDRNSLERQAVWPAPDLLSRVASALVPAAHMAPPAFEYIARSTMICAGGAPVLSTMAPKRLELQHVGQLRDDGAVDEIP